MNVLIFDSSAKLSPLIRSIIGGYHIRVSASADTEDAKLKIHTALFDAIIVNSDESSKELMGFAKKEFPHIPYVVIDNGNGEVSTDDHTIAIIKRPIMTESIVKAIFKLRHYVMNNGQEKTARAVDLIGEIVLNETAIPCKITDLTERSAIVEAPNPSGDESSFNLFFSEHGGETFETRYTDALSVPRSCRGRMVFCDRSPAKAIRRVGLVFEVQQAEGVKP